MSLVDHVGVVLSLANQQPSRDRHRVTSALVQSNSALEYAVAIYDSPTSNGKIHRHPAGGRRGRETTEGTAAFELDS